MPLVGFAFTSPALDFLATVPHKQRRQIIKRAKSLHTNPFPQSARKLKGVTTDEGGPVYRERSGTYRILYTVRENPAEVLILDIDHRKDIYKMPKTKTEPADEMRMSERDFDTMMARALGAPPPPDEAPQEPEAETKTEAKPARKNRKAG